jgi:hypothetical protein
MFQNIKPLLSVGLVCLLAIGCASGATQAQRIRVQFDRLIESPAAFNGKAVEVDGFMIRGPEQRYLLRSRAAKSETDNPNVCLTLTNVKGVVGDRGFYERDVTVKGIFRAHIIPPDVVDFAACNDAGIELQDVTFRSK